MRAGGRDVARRAVRGSPPHRAAHRVESQDRAAAGVHRPNCAAAGADGADARAARDPREHLVRHRVDPHDRVPGGRATLGRVVPSRGEVGGRERNRDRDAGRQERASPPAARSDVAAQAKRRARRGDQRAARRVAVGRILRERPAQDPVGLLAQRRIARSRRRHRIVDVAPQHHHDGVAAVRRLPGQRLEQDAAERVDVRATIDPPARDEFGGSVSRGAREHAASVSLRRGRAQAEVGEVHVLRRIRCPTASDQDVRGLDVSMDKAPPMRGVEGARDGCEQRDRALRLEPRARREDATQVRPLDEPHRDEQASLVLAGLVDRQHVRVIEARGEARLAQEALAEPVVIGEVRREQLQRDRAPKPRVDGLVHLAHAAPGDQRLDPIGGERLPGAQLRVRGHAQHSQIARRPAGAPLEARWSPARVQ